LDEHHTNQSMIIQRNRSQIGELIIEDSTSDSCHNGDEEIDINYICRSNITNLKKKASQCKELEGNVPCPEMH
jgi:hypothetical protein